MPLTRLMGRFTGIKHTEELVLVNRPGWLFAQTCQVWHEQEPDQVSTLLLVYKSPLVTDTKQMYRPVAERVLQAEKLDVLFEHEQDDEEMMYGTGQLALFRISTPTYCSAYYPTEQIREILKQSIEGEPVL